MTERHLSRGKPDKTIVQSDAFEYLARTTFAENQAIVASIPDSAEISGAVLFFASDLASCITGQSLDVNGGQVMC